MSWSLFMFAKKHVSLKGPETKLFISRQRKMVVFIGYFPVCMAILLIQDDLSAYNHEKKWYCSTRTLLKDYETFYRIYDTLIIIMLPY